MTTTRMFTDEKKFNYYPQKLEKSGIDSINLYKFGDIRISKLLKHPDEFKSGIYTNGKEMKIDEESVRSCLWMEREILLYLMRI